MSNITVDGWPVLNPYPPLVFFPPEVASQAQLVIYFFVGTSGVYIWDLLNTIPEDYKMVVKQGGLRLPTFIYFLSKLSTFGFVVLNTIFETAPVSHCFLITIVVGVLFALAMSSTSLLFFLRARAVFHGNPFATAIFGVLWLGVVGGSLTPITGIRGANLGPTRYCTIGMIRFYSVAAAITPLINDSIVFLAISWRLCTYRALPTRKNGARRLRTVVFGEHLPAFSKSLLQNGQVYFLTTVGANMITVIMLFATSVPNTLRLLPPVPNTALMNIMAGRVFRKTLLTVPGSTAQSTSNPVSLSLVGNHNSGSGAGPMKPDNLLISISQTVDAMV